ncbi:MAG: MauE/DoxX family redox-associated membrane protein [Chloroflexota bacterium]
MGQSHMGDKKVTPGKKNPYIVRQTKPAPPTGRFALLRQPSVVLIARLIIGAVFIISAAGKLTHPDAFVRAVASYEVLPEALLGPFGAAFPWLELAMGVLLLVGLFTRLAAVGAAGLMAIFLALMGTAFLQGKSIDCGCFVGVIQETVGPATLIRDTLLLLILAPVVMARHHILSLDAHYRNFGASPVRNVTLALAAVVVTLGVGAAISWAWASPSPSSQTLSAGGWRLGAAAPAKVEIVVFSDFECPACRLVAPMLQKLVDDNKGAVGFTYKHFPLPQHDRAQADAEAAEAAGEQGKFWQIHDAIFAQGGLFTPAELRALAGQLGLDLKRYDASLASGRPRQQVSDDFAEGKRIGVSYTPYIIINGEVVQITGYQSLKDAVDRKLNR